MQSGRVSESRIEGPAEYVFDNSSKRAEARYRELSALYDEPTIRHVEHRGIDQGWSCLEVGGGGGSIASWLCTRVGPTGRVLATDINPQFLHTLCFPNLEVRRHDIRREGFPARQFHLAHARLVLMHLPEPHVALSRMLASLRPGGWMVVEEFDGLSILPDSAANPGEEELPVMRAFNQVLKARGVEMRYGRWLPQQLRECGLVNIGAEASVSLWKGGSPGTTLFKLNCEELSGPIIRSGLMSPGEIEADIKRLDEGDFCMLSPMMWTAWGQVPESTCRTASASASAGVRKQDEWFHVS